MLEDMMITIFNDDIGINQDVIEVDDVVKLFDKIRAEIQGMYRIVLKNTPKDDWAVKWNECVDEVLKVIDKYRGKYK